MAALSALPDDRLDDSLAALVRKEILSIQSDPRAPDHGQYGFLQSLVQKVAYDTLAKKDRRVRHLAAAEHLERTWTGDDDEIVEVIAAHYAEAYRSAPDEPGSEPVRARARDALTRAGRRAQQLAAPRAARGYFLSAAELADTDEERAALLELAGTMASVSASFDEAMERPRGSRGAVPVARPHHDAARVSARIGDVSLLTSKLDDALGRMTSASNPEARRAGRGPRDARGPARTAPLLRGASRRSRRHHRVGARIAESLWLPETIRRR